MVPIPNANPFNAFRRVSRKTCLSCSSLSDMAFSPYGLARKTRFLPTVFRRLRREFLETRVVRVMAMSAQQVLLLPVPLPRPLSVDSRLPVAVLVPVALAAKTVTLRKIDQLAGDKPEFVAASQVVAIEAPPLFLGMVLQLDIRVLFLQLPSLRVRLHLLVAFGAGEDALRERRRRNHVGFLALQFRWGKPEFPASCLCRIEHGERERYK